MLLRVTMAVANIWYLWVFSLLLKGEGEIRDADQHGRVQQQKQQQECGEPAHLKLGTVAALKFVLYFLIGHSKEDRLGFSFYPFPNNEKFHLLRKTFNVHFMFYLKIILSQYFQIHKIDFTPFFHIWQPCKKEYRRREVANNCTVQFSDFWF